VASYRVISSSMAMSIALLRAISLMLSVGMELMDLNFLIASFLVMKFLRASITKVLPISQGTSEGSILS